MPLSIDEFQERLTAANVLSADESRSAVQTVVEGELPVADGAAVAQQLVAAGKLTPYQAERLCQGPGGSLTLGNYIILDHLGQGGMGTVFRAEHRQMKRQVALKVVRKDRLTSPNAALRFQREVETIAKLDHPNIVTAFDADEVEGVCFLAMQYVEGRNLSAVVRQGGPLSVAQAADCVLQAARGLAYAHQQGIIHRDVKPSNLLLDRHGAVKLLDLGLAALAVHDADHPETLTGGDLLVGTIDYISPEQAKSPKLADERSDIYSLGLTLWYLLTGRVAYDDESQVEKLLAHRERPLPSLVETRPEVPTALDSIFRRMAAKHPSDRYATMNEVAAALESFQLAHGETRLLLADNPDLRAGARSQSAATQTAKSPAVLPGKTTRFTSGALAWGLLALALVAFVVWRWEVRRGRATRAADRTAGPAAAQPPASEKTPPEKVPQPQPPAPVPPAIPPAPVPLPPLPADLQRYVAEMVIKAGGSIGWATREYGNAARLEEIPAEPFVVRSITASGAKEITDESVLAFGQLPYLNELDLADTGVGNQGLRGLSGLESLDSLTLNRTAVTDDGIRWLTANRDLCRLALQGTQVGDASLKEIRKLPRLRELFLGQTAITDGGLKELAGHRGIVWLSLVSNKSLTGKGAAELKFLPSLQILDLAGTSVDDAGALALAQFPQLTFVNLSSTQVTKDGAARLQAALREAIVFHPALPPDVKQYRAAQWVLAQKGTLNLVPSSAKADNPQARFAIGSVAFDVNAGPDKGAENLAGLRRLTNLRWQQSLADAPREIESIATLLSLRTLQLNGTKMTEADLRRLQALTQLETLNFSTDEGPNAGGLEHLAAFEHLRSLLMHGGPITDAELAPLARLTQLRHINLLGCPKVTSDAAVHLAPLTSLRSLALSLGGMDNGAVRHLKQIKSLRLLRIPNTKITDAGVAELQHELPQCAIFWSGGAVVPKGTSRTEVAP